MRNFDIKMFMLCAAENILISQSNSLHAGDLKIT